MKETVRCCISCILPCGPLDVIRIVHANGHIEEIAGDRTVSAGDIMRAHPMHVLRKPPSPASVGDDSAAAGGPPRAIVLPPTAELQRGKIYFLVPVSSTPEKAARPPSPRRRRRRDQGRSGAAAADRTRLLACSSERYLSEILAEKASASTERRRGRVGVWRPHLDSISELSGDL
ncbi:hypothetical protein AXF42_Ash006786 [Apostasia shenzhenica]|uniref:Uncharacterized protein n=1 Tax=Apostasia shenzhenica TaxID=1088818 RepID=A0A2I0AJ42_9ASPA|nr:hypothetical protein AXF42_Ash006786 [Apostasia shenzhenica]